jgi:hypothetical protein
MEGTKRTIVSAVLKEVTEELSPPLTIQKFSDRETADSKTPT